MINIEKSKNYNLFFSKNKNKLGVGAIIGIIIPIIVIIGLIILLLAYFSKKNTKIKIGNESSIENVKYIDGSLSKKI